RRTPPKAAAPQLRWPAADRAARGLQPKPRPPARRSGTLPAAGRVRVRPREGKHDARPFGGTGHLTARCSKNSGISSVCGTSWARDDRKNRAFRSQTGFAGPSRSKNSSISFTDGLRGSESLEKVGQLAPAPADRSMAVRALAGVARLFSARFRFASCHPLRYNEMEREHTFWWRLVR